MSSHPHNEFMAERLDDAVVFLETAISGQRPAPPGLGSMPFARMVEREISSLVALDRFQKNAERMVALTKGHPTGSVEAARFPDSMPYARFGNVYGQERLLREVENDFGVLLANATSLEDLVYNAALDYSQRAVAWVGCELLADGTLPDGAMKVRKQVAKKVRKAYKASGDDVAGLDWVKRLRNKATHEHYFYAAVVQGAGEVVFTEEATDYASMDLSKPTTVSDKRLIDGTLKLHRYIDWFVLETVQKSSPTLEEWRKEVDGPLLP